MAWMPLRKYCEFYPWPSHTTLRWMVAMLDREEKMYPFVQRHGKIYLIEDQLFQKWLGSEESSALRQRWIEVHREKKKSREQRESESSPS
jgi:AAA+ ATPase superfamily predicted ATPase